MSQHWREKQTKCCDSIPKPEEGHQEAENKERGIQSECGFEADVGVPVWPQCPPATACIVGYNRHTLLGPHAKQRQSAR